MNSNQSVINKALVLYILLLTLLIPQLTNSQSSVSYSRSTQLVSASATLTFTIITGVTIVSGDCIKIVVTNPYTTNSGYYTPFSSVSCSITSGHSVTCSKSSDTIMQMTFTAGSSTTTVTGTISSFNNPYSKTSVTVKTGYYGSCGSTVNSEKTSTFSFTAGTMSTVTLSSSSTVVGATNSVLTVSFKPATGLKATGIIQLVVPTWYTLPSGDSDTSMLTSSSKVTSSSFTAISSSSFTSSSRTLSFTYTASSSISTSTTVSFSVSNFNNPISNAAESGFYLNTYDTSGNSIDLTSTSFSVSAPSTPASLSSTSVKIYDSSGTVSYSIAQTGRKVLLDFTLAVPLEQYCYIRITFPDEIKIDIDETMDTYVGTGFFLSSSGSTISSSDVTKVGYTSGNYVVIPACIDSDNLGPGQQGTIQMSDIVSPAQLKDTSSFQIEVFKDSSLSNKIASGTSGIYIQKSSMSGGTISSMTITPASYVVQTATSYTISFKVANNLYYDSRIEIQMPSLVTSLIGPTCSITSVSSNIDGSYSCSRSTNTKYFYVDTPFASDGLSTWDYTTSADGSTLTVKINGATNPTSARSAGSWKVITYNKISSSYYQVDSGTSTTSFTATAGTLSASGTGISSTDLATYSDDGLTTFSIALSHSIPVKGYISITLPSEMSISSSSSVRASCYYGSSLKQQTCSVPSTSEIIMQLSSITSEHSSSDVLTIAFLGIRNPRTYKQSSAFTIKTLDSDSYTIDSGTGFKLTCTSMGEIDGFSVSISNYTNGALNNYTFSLQTTIPLSAKDKLYITFPSETTIESNVTCYIISGVKTITCSKSDYTLIVTFSSLSYTTGTFSFIVENIYNPPSTKTSSTFSSIYMVDSSGYKIQQLDSSTSVTVTTTTPANILTYKLSQGKTDLNVTTTYTITFTPSNIISSTGSILLTWPSQLTILSNVGCKVTTEAKYSSNCAVNTTQRTILMTGIFAKSDDGYTDEVEIELDPVRNPEDNKAVNGFTLVTYDDADQVYKIDQITGSILVPKTPCEFPCKTCSGTNRYYCNTCFSDLGYPYIMKYNTSVSKCLQYCPTGYTSNGDSAKSCVACDTSCASCVDNSKYGDKSKCITCNTGYSYRYTPDQKCMTSCSGGYYEQSAYTCDVCKTPCKECTGSASYCTACYSNSTYKYLYDNSCVSTCSQGYVALDGQCQKCTSPCLTCVNSTSTCTSCDTSSTSKYFFAFKCYEKCPTGTTTNETTLSCSGCLAGCDLCDSFNQSKCLQCNSSYLIYQGNCVKSCPDGYHPNKAGTACTDELELDLPMIYFPHLIVSLVLILISVIAFIKDRGSLIISNILLLLGPIEIIAYCVQSAYSIIYSTYKYAGMSIAAVIFYIILNVCFTAIYECKIADKDEEFKIWKQQHKKTYRTVLALSGIFSFKLLRLFYSNLFGFENFKAEYTSPGQFQKLMTIFTILHILTANCPILAVDAVGLIYLKWGTQLYITMIETALLALLMVILGSIELSRLKDYIDDDDITPYKFVNSDSVMNASQMDDQLDKKIREEMLRKIMMNVKGNRDLFLNNKLDELISQFGPRRCRSMTGLGNELEDDPRRVKTYPNTPRKEDEMPGFDKPFQPDNVYAESKPPNPLGKVGKTYVDADAQAMPQDFEKIFARKGGDIVNFEGSESQRSRAKKNKKRGRKNQYYTQIDAEDDEEAENMDNNERMDSDNLDVIREEDEEEEMKRKMEKKKQQEEEQKRLQQEKEEQLKKQQEEEEKKRILQEQQQKEEEEEKRRKQLELEEKINQERIEREKSEQEKMLQEQQKREEEKRQKQLEMERELQKIEEEKLRKEAEEAERKLKEELESKRLEEEISPQKLQQNQEDDMFKEEKAIGEGSMAQQLDHQNRPPTMGGISDANISQDVIMGQDNALNDFINNRNEQIQIPPDAQKRNFNENDILGDFDRDEKGNVIILQDQNGFLVDKQGRRVNEKGYILDPKTGDIVENQQNQKMFDKEDIDERGEIPAPFCVEKYNFNPFNIKGDFDYDKQGRPIITKNKKGEFVDKKGRKVNKRGWLVDNLGNVADKFGRKKFDKKQLSADNDLQKLFNYNGRRYDINDVCGIFDRDQNGNILFKQNKKGQKVDNLGRLVNERGYLIDEQGNVIDKDGKKIFEKKYLKYGEFPKIFPFSQFNIKNILGNFEMDPLGNPILDKNAKQELIDRDGRRVNKRGYLIDDHGNVIDRRGQQMFDKIILDEEGEIPKVFRTGLLKSDSASSLSRLMSEIEKNQPSDYENEDRMVQREIQRMQQNQQRQNNSNQRGASRLSGNTSVDSMMEDTPSNYNIANQRFDPREQNRKQNASNNRQNNQSVDQIEEEDSQFDLDFINDGGQLRKRRVKKKKNKVITEYREPSDKDHLMAKAYGGVAKGTTRKVIAKGGQPRNIHTPASNMGNQSQLHRLAGSVSGYQKNEVGRIGEDTTRRRDQFRDPGNVTQQSNFLNETNDPAFMAVPEHHIREQRLKQRKMNELKQKKRNNKKQYRPQGGDAEFEKMFGKDIDEFLEDSDWDLESIGNMSHFSKGTARSAFNDGRIRGLESIYLQRIETSMKKGGKQQHKPPLKAKFRAMQDRFIDDAQQIAQIENNNSNTNLNNSQSRPNKLFEQSANTTGLAQNKSDIFKKVGLQQTQYNRGY